MNKILPREHRMMFQPSTFHFRVLKVSQIPYYVVALIAVAAAVLNGYLAVYHAKLMRYHARTFHPETNPDNGTCVELEEKLEGGLIRWSGFYVAHFFMDLGSTVFMGFIVQRQHSKNLNRRTAAKFWIIVHSLLVAALSLHVTLEIFLGVLGKRQEFLSGGTVVTKLVLLGFFLYKFQAFTAPVVSHRVASFAAANGRVTVRGDKMDEAANDIGTISREACCNHPHNTTGTNASEEEKKLSKKEKEVIDLLCCLCTASC